MRYRNYLDIDTKAYFLTTPKGSIIVSGAASCEKNNLILIKIYLLFQDRLSDQDQYDSEITSEESSWALWYSNQRLKE